MANVRDRNNAKTNLWRSMPGEHGRGLATRRPVEAKWYVLEYRKAKARKWHFHSMSGDKAMLETLAADLRAAGWEAQVREN